jgi:hypothetical protein
MRFKVNQAAITSFADPVWRKQIPFVIARTITETVKKQRLEQQKAMEKHMDGGPVRFTKSGVRYKSASKRNLRGIVYYNDDRPYMNLIVDGGEDRAKKKKLSEPVDVRVTKQGNIPKGYTRKNIDKERFFGGIPKGRSGEKYRGLWRRVGRTGYTRAGKPRGKIRLKVSWARGSRFQRKTFPAREVFNNHVPTYFTRLLPIKLRQTIREEIARLNRITGF